MKQLSPKKLVFYASFFTTIVQLLILLFTAHIFNYRISINVYIFIFLAFFISTYFLFYYVLQEFIYKKIKLIYKSIRTVKSKNKTHKSENILKEVEEEVEQWKASQKNQIEQFKKMEKYRKEYVGNVSHELKTPIFNIQGYLETLTSIDDKNSKIFESFLNKAIENTERLNTIVRDLEIISKSETDSFDLTLTSFSIRNLVLKVFDELEMISKKNNISLRLKNNGKCPDFKVVADKERIHQVLSNLITNAIKYNKPNGKVTASCYDMEEQILIEITDTGIGIKQKHLPRLFERFYRVDKNRSRKKGGSGLGLAIVKHIVESHGQTVHVRSTPDIGTTFGFTLQKAKS